MIPCFFNIRLTVHAKKAKYTKPPFSELDLTTVSGTESSFRRVKEYSNNLSSSIEDTLEAVMLYYTDDEVTIFMKDAA